MLYLYLSSPATWLSVLMPALICIWALTTSPLNRQQWKTFLVCTALSFVSARWELKAEVEQLFLIPVMLVWLMVLLYRGDAWHGRQAFAVVFLSLWLVDMSKAALLHASGQLSGPAFYWGVGGAGIKDGLALFPSLAWLLTCYIDWRRPRPVSAETPNPASTTILNNKP